MDKGKQLEKLKTKMQEDESLPLRRDATNLVLGEGNPEAKILFLGEAPGYWEDQKGRPFVGRSGAFLNELLYSIELKRKEGFTIGNRKDEVFISNVICYRPPANRDPTPTELAAFAPYIDEMIEIIRPRVVVTLGRFSMAKFLGLARIGSVHGRLYSINWRGREIVVVPMYHPAAGLRNAGIKAETMEDFKKLPGILTQINKKETEQMLLV